MTDPAGKSVKQRRADPPPPSPPPSPRYAANAVHMVRTVQIITLNLSEMADQKASMLLGASFVVFSLAVGQSLAGEMSWPLAVLALFAVLSALFAAIAVMPSIGKPGPGAGAINRLFFGHFHDLDEEKWTRDVLAGLESEESMFRLMLHDAFQNGQVLHRRKYRWLGYSYRTFVAGLLATLAAFIAELVLR